MNALGSPSHGHPELHLALRDLEYARNPHSTMAPDHQHIGMRPRHQPDDGCVVVAVLPQRSRAVIASFMGFTSPGACPQGSDSGERHAQWKVNRCGTLGGSDGSSGSTAVALTTIPNRQVGH